MTKIGRRSPGPTQPARRNGYPTVCGRIIGPNDRTCTLHVDHAGICEPLRRLDITDVVAVIEPAPGDGRLCTLCKRRFTPQAWMLILPEVRLRGPFPEHLTICRSCASELGSHLLKIPSGPAPDPSDTDDPADWHPRT